MARLACPQSPGIPLHVVLRGVRADLSAALDASECALHAYARLATHLHLLLTPGRADAATRLAGRLGASALDATPVHARRYLLACMRYIELNPVRAGIVRHPAHYAASSYRANALGEADARLVPHAAYCALGRSPAERCAAYRAGFGAALRSPARRPGG